jgi:pyruvate dehydrogenase E1 component
MNAVYQAQFNRYLHNRGIKDTSQQRVWAFLGDGEMDEVESRGLLQTAANDELDNLTFVVNCNLQRLDGPVRGNGKIMQELEAFFRGAGWNVIKVVWGRGWDPLAGQRREGALVNLMNATTDGDYQTFKANDGAYVRKHFFGGTRGPRPWSRTGPTTRSGASPAAATTTTKVYSAYKAAVEFTGAPTVILAHTIKGYFLGKHFAGRNATHQMKKLALDDLKAFRDRVDVPITDEQLEADPYRPPTSTPGPQDDPRKYLQERRVQARRLPPGAAWGPHVHLAALRQGLRASKKGSGKQQVATTMAFVRLLKDLMRDKEFAPRVVPIIPTRRAPSGWTRSSPPSRSTTRTGRTTRRWTTSSCSPTASPRPARSCTPASTRPAR